VPEVLNKLEREIEIVARHLAILDIIRKEGPIGIIKLSEKTGWQHHKIRYSLRLLEKDGLIKPTSEGAVITPKTEEFINELKNMLMEMLKKLENIYNFPVPRFDNNNKKFDDLEYYEDNDEDDYEDEELMDYFTGQSQSTGTKPPFVKAKEKQQKKAAETVQTDLFE